MQKLSLIVIGILLTCFSPVAHAYNVDWGQSANINWLVYGPSGSTGCTRSVAAAVGLPVFTQWSGNTGSLSGWQTLGAFGQTGTFVFNCELAPLQVPTSIGSDSATVSCPVGMSPSGTTCVAAGPNLVAGNITPITAVDSVPTPYSVTVTNAGPVGTSGGFNVLFQKANDASGTGAVDLGTTTTGALGAGAPISVSRTITLTTGTAYIRACADKSNAADANGVVVETNEGDNCSPAWTAVTVSGAPVNGVCAAAHYFCSAGASVNNVDGALAWTWNCNGVNGGSNSPQCSESKNLDCSATGVTWGAGGVCTAAAPATLNANNTASLPNTNIAYTGSAVFSCSNAVFSYSSGSCNANPLANAGADVAITLPINSAAPTGQSASDPDGTFTVQWTNTVKPVGSPVVTITGGGTLSPTFSNLTFVGTYTFQLQVTDNGGVSRTDTMNVVVSGSNPILVNPTKTNITTVSAELGGTITSDGGAAITARGTCWGVGNPPATNCSAAAGTGLGAYTHVRNGMLSNTLYYYRAYADNALGFRGYSPVDSFTTGNTPSAAFTSTPTCPGGISVGSNSCNTTLGWTSGGFLPSGVDLRDCGGGLYANYPTGLQSGIVSLPYNSGCYRITDASNGNNLSGDVTIPVDCAVGSSWNGSICNASPVVTFVSSNQTIALGQPLVFTSNATDANGDLIIHGFTWQNPSGNWEYQVGGGAANITAQSAGVNCGTFNNRWCFAATGASNGRSLTFTPTVAGTYVVQWVAQDASGVWGYSPAYTITVNTPSSIDVSPITWSPIIAAGSPVNGVFTVTNSGGTALNISGSSVVGAGYTCITNCGALVVAANNGTQQITVRFLPPAVTTYPGTLTITSDVGGVPGTPTNIPMNGTGRLPIVAVGGLDYGKVKAKADGTSFKDLTFTITNPTAVNIGAVTVQTNGAPYVCHANCNQNLGPSPSSITFTIRFTPTALGDFNGTFWLNVDNTTTWTLTGVGVPSTIDVREQ